MDFIKKVILFIEEAMQVHSSGSKSQRRDCSGMKRVGILANVDESKGGVYQYTHSLIYALSSDSSNKYIVFSKHGDKNFDSYGLEVRNFIKPNNFYSRSFFMLLMLLLECRNSFFMSKEEKEIFSDIDLFISPISNPYPHFYLDREFIFTLHDMQERYYPSFFTLKERFLRHIVNKAMIKKSSKIICESSFVRNDVVSLVDVDSKKVHVIQSPPPAEFLSYSIKESRFESVRGKYDLPEKYILYPAQCWFHKNHIRLLEAFSILSKRYDDIYLVLTGARKNNYQKMMDRVVELDLTLRVLHLGYVDYKDMPYLYKMSQLLVMPTLFESVSMPIYEAFSLRVPVCCSNVVALPEQVGDAALIFDPFRIEDIAEKIEQLLVDNFLVKEKIKKGFCRVASFDHESYRNKLLEVVTDGFYN